MSWPQMSLRLFSPLKPALGKVIKAAQWPGPRWCTVPGTSFILGCKRSVVHWVSRPEGKCVQTLCPHGSLTHPRVPFCTAAICPPPSHPHPTCPLLPRKLSFHWFLTSPEKQNFTTGRLGHRTLAGSREKRRPRGDMERGEGSSWSPGRASDSGSSVET